MKNQPFLLATDLDHTLVGDKSALLNLFEFYKAENTTPALVYVTGRHLSSALDLIKSEPLPNPDILITDVGTAIYHAPDWSEDAEWTERMNETWKPDEIFRIAKDIPSLIPQNLPHNKRLSFTVDSIHSDSIQILKSEMDRLGVAYHLVYSSGRDLDILPEQSGKGKAVEYILQHYAMKGVNILLAGDSGNDAEMLSLNYPAVIVGNAQPELKNLPSHPSLFRATEQYANGIKEAWQHYYPHTN